MLEDDDERIEEQLRSEIYEVLVELALAEKQDKLEVVNRLNVACSKSHDLITHGKIPEA